MHCMLYIKSDLGPVMNSLFVYEYKQILHNSRLSYIIMKAISCKARLHLNEVQR